MKIFSKNNCNSNRSILIPLIAYVAAIKLILFLLDPTVMFFIDDSSRYIDTAVASYIPPDRSFLYGFLIRWITYFGQSLTNLIIFQVFCSAASAVLLGYVLNRFLSVNRVVSCAFAMLCAVAPIQLMYERYVMTETVSLLFFALFVTSAFFYLRDPKIRSLILLSLSGVILIAFRLSYLPIVLSGAVVVPCLAFFNLPVRKVGEAAERWGTGKAEIRKRIFTSCIHIIISCLLTYGLHSTYKMINGRLSNKPPAYQYCDGYHLVSSWAPLLTKEDFSDPAIEGYLQQYLSFSLKDRFQRINHRWSYYGLVGYIHRMNDSKFETNRIARDTAMNILYRDPIGVMKLASRSYMDYWNMKLLKRNLLGDRSIREYPDKLLEILKSNYHINGEGLRFQKTLSNQYYLNAIPWYMVLFCLPLIMVISIVMDKGHYLSFSILLGIFALLILMNSTVLLHRNTMRFFHPNEWIAILFLGVLFDRAMKSNWTRIIGRRLRIIINRLIIVST